MKFGPKNWSTFQHYKDRAPTWVKLHKSILDDYEYHCLPTASKALAPLLWLLASEYDDGIIDASLEKISFRLRMDNVDFLNAIKPLIDSGFFVLYEDASELLASREHASIPEKRRDTSIDTSEEIQVQKIARSADADDAQDLNAAFQAYNETAVELGWPQAQKISPTRKARMRARLKDVGGLDGWHEAMTRARASPYLRGETRRSQGYEKWTPDIDFFLQESSFTKLMEGKYDDRNGSRGPSGASAAASGIAAALDHC